MLNVCKIEKREAPFFRVQRICPDRLNCDLEETMKGTTEKGATDTTVTVTYL